MITGRFATPGKTRSCPHCRATILDSATVCPGCHHHLRFDASGAGQRVQPAATPLRVEGTLRHPSTGGAWEYSVVLAIRNDRGEEIARQVVGVGALQPSEGRTFTLAVEVFKPAEMREPKPQAAETSSTGAPPPGLDPRAPARPGAPSKPTIAPGPPSPSFSASSESKATTQPPIQSKPVTQAPAQPRPVPHTPTQPRPLVQTPGSAKPGMQPAAPATAQPLRPPVQSPHKPAPGAPANGAGTTSGRGTSTIRRP